MDRLLDSPWFLRFTALFLAILLFYTVKADEGKFENNSSSEDMEVIRDVPVEVYYDNENLIVTGVPETVNVAIEGPVNIVQTTKMLKDFTLYVDLTSLPMGEHQVRIQHENISEKVHVRIDPASIDINIEERITETFRIEPEFNERLLAEGFNLVSMEAQPSTIEVTGAKSVVESISFVKVTVAIDAGVQESFEQEARVRVLDRDLNKLDVDITPENVTIKVDVQENTKEVPIVINETGTPPNGVTINSITPEAASIVLSGPKRILNEIEAFPIDIDVSKIEKSGTVEVKLKKPNDLFSLSRTTVNVKIDATIEGAVEEEEEEEVAEETVEEVETTVETTDVEDVQVVITGLDEKFKGTFVEPVNGLVTITVKAAPDVISKLKKSDFAVSINASTASEEGEEVFPIHVKGPPDVEWTLSMEEATLKIELA
ncbi:YbbR-like domain-containing protein [Sporosarcina pasteurii]|uniref:Uncharacterized protein conserved in bacteria n=1 Tax=Sporosarcina pasteurii TaxID=1474 RepID=A0A380CI35_SPOPA|nr:CdaR family protein [Sporosarcina pasteurii]MDS9472050.1 CdaR family protein [Sporosarcina pasteurii]QBQ06778.1 hypothetical protein E2C16_14505 [Sporosarcina pasteurii]SUJ20922.1 Uncharacterized protein conserved in bacteria [Sporosarcina pasteurii]